MIENLDQTINRKKKTLPDGVSIIGPDVCLDVQTRADWLISLLCQMYVQHGITKNREQLLTDLETENCKVWFAVRNGVPIASAALVNQSDGAVEVGRAVSLEKGVGGLLMMLAAMDHLNSSNKPLVAEVRLSDVFMGIPSGEATQIISLKHLGLNPQALVPAFNHGEPNRQEMFAFSSSEKIVQIEPLFLSDDTASLERLQKTAVGLGGKAFQSDLNIQTRSEFTQSIKWIIAAKEPFCVVIPEIHGSDLQVVMKEAEMVSPFTLIPISARPKLTQGVIECLNQGFVPCGFDRNLDKDGHPVLLLGKLRGGTLLAPIKLIRELFDQNIVNAMMEIDRSFRDA